MFGKKKVVEIWKRTQQNKLRKKIAFTSTIEIIN